MAEDSDNTDILFGRIRQLRNKGVDYRLAVGIADLERRISMWPKKWGDHLQILIYGDFKPPEKKISVPQLGITVYPENLRETFIKNALCVLKADVTISDKSVSALIEAIRRINIFLGTHTLVGWGNGGCGWWSFVTHSIGGGVIPKFNEAELTTAINSVCELRLDVRQKIEAALYWIREPKNLTLESHKPDVLRVFSAYWNAFECLVDAVLLIRPRKRMSKSEKQAAIDSFVSAKSGKLTSGDIVECYQQFVNPGIVAKATHVFHVCYPEHAELYVKECFKMKPRKDRLYDVRNAINHGDIDAENLTELLRVEARLGRLWMIVWRLFGRLIVFPAPVDRDDDDSVAT
jgi:hypothetical protein